MISGTWFMPIAWKGVEACLRDRNVRVAAASDIAHVQAECEAGRAQPLVSPDGVMVVGARGAEDGPQLWIWMAAGFKPGAFLRAESALDAIARDMGARSIGFRPARRGWSRLVGDKWQKRNGCLVRSVDG